MKIHDAVSEGSGPVNEDGWGFAGADDDVTAAWIFDGVTGINGRNYLPGDSDAAWLVGRAQAHLAMLAGSDAGLDSIVARLAELLMADTERATRGINLPADYDPPAACLVLVKRYGRAWKAARLGDSCLLARDGNDHHILAASPNNAFDNWLAREAQKRRAAGIDDVKALLEEFRPQLRKGRAQRNKVGGYSILEASPNAAAHTEYLDLGSPDALLLCTDGFYRAVDHYGVYQNVSLIDASLLPRGAARVLGEIRAVEASDPSCKKYQRFKPADDATAVVLRRPE